MNTRIYARIFALLLLASCHAEGAETGGGTSRHSLSFEARVRSAGQLSTKQLEPALAFYDPRHNGFEFADEAVVDGNLETGFSLDLLEVPSELQQLSLRAGSPRLAFAVVVAANSSHRGADGGLDHTATSYIDAIATNLAVVYLPDALRLDSFLAQALGGITAPGYHLVRVEQRPKSVDFAACEREAAWLAADSHESQVHDTSERGVVDAGALARLRDEASAELGCYLTRLAIDPVTDDSPIKLELTALTH